MHNPWFALQPPYTICSFNQELFWFFFPFPISVIASFTYWMDVFHSAIGNFHYMPTNKLFGFFHFTTTRTLRSLGRELSAWLLFPIILPCSTILRFIITRTFHVFNESFLAIKVFVQDISNGFSQHFSQFGFWDFNCHILCFYLCKDNENRRGYHLLRFFYCLATTFKGIIPKWN